MIPVLFEFVVILAGRVSVENDPRANGENVFKIAVCFQWNVWSYCVEDLWHISAHSCIVVTTKVDNRVYIYVIVQQGCQCALQGLQRYVLL